MAVIETANLSKTFANGTEALRELTLSLDEGSVFGLLGPNGAGKSTTVRLLNGTLKPTSGSARVLDGADEVTIRTRTATLTEEAAMYESLTVEQNLQFFADLYGIPRPDASARITSLLAELEIESRRNDRVGQLSTGLKKRAQLARTLLHRPRIVFLDEPTSGLDPDSAAGVMELIATMVREEGLTVLLCTHNLPLAQQVCSHFGFLSEGRLVASGTNEELVASLVRTPMVDIATDRGVIRREVDPAVGAGPILRELIDEGTRIDRVAPVEPDLKQVYFHYLGRERYEP